MAKYLDTRIHLAHISTAKSIEIIRKAKKDGVKVTCETCPHYFSLTVEDIEDNSFDANFKVNPPLGDKADVEAVKQALADGTIDCIATDHAPHSLAEKELPFEDAPFGFIGLELAFSLAYMNLVKTGRMDLKELSKKLSYGPASVVHLKNSGKIEEGFEASLCVIDLSACWQVTKDTLVSKSKNTPFMGKQMEGKVIYTVHKSNIVYSFSNLK